MTPYYQDEFATIYHGDCREILPQLEPVDLVLTDPPYGTGNFSWDSKIDTNELFSHLAPLARDFVCFFGQMPYLLDWHVSASSQQLSLLEHVVWIKREGSPQHRIQRTHESIFIYGVRNGRRQFYRTKGPWADVKLPGYLEGLITIEGVSRYVSDLKLKAAGGGRLSERKRRAHSSYNETRFLNSSKTKWKDRSPDSVDYSNAWSFLPPNRSELNGEADHPTIKPLALMQRLCEMLAPENGVILDPFAGSGTTAKAAKELGVKSISVEIEEKYCEIAARRLQQGVLWSVMEASA